MYKKISLLIILMAVSVSRASAAPKSATLDDLIADALANNPELRVLEAAVESARGGLITATAWQNPEVSVAPGIKRVNADDGDESTFHFEAELVQPLRFPGKRAVDRAIAVGNVELQELALDVLRWQLRQNVRKVFSQLLAVTKTVELRREQVESSRLFAEAAQRRAQSGYASDFESARSEAELITAKKALREADAVSIGLRATLNTLLGRNATDALHITGSLNGDLPPVTVSDCVTIALSRNPTLRLVSKHVQQADLALRAARLERRPDFFVGPSLEYTEDEQVLALGLSLPLPLWDRKRGVIATGTAEQQKALAELTTTRAEISGAAAAAAARYEAARESADLYTADFLDRLKSAVTQAEHGLASNATTLLIYLDAKQAYFDTLSEYYETLSTIAESSADLESATGCPLNDLSKHGGKE